MGVLEIAVSESNLGLMNKGALDKTFYRKMALLISSCWLRILDSLFFVFRVIGLYKFRIRMKDDSCALKIDDSEIWEPLREAIELKERRNCSLFEEEASSFSFKFEHQFTKDTKRTDGESKNHITDRSTETTTTEIRFLRLKDPLQSIGSQKQYIPTIMAHLSKIFWPFCRPKSSSDPSEKFLKELQSDLETIYVGQTCLSGEFLRWQYKKARGIPESDPYRNHQYNQVAGEFQQFQVIIQRFIKNESFQGPRLPNYVKNRCVLRNLIQVPIIKEDYLKDKMEEHKTGSDVITSEMLEEIMEDAIRIFWEFIKADKNEGPMILKGFIGGHVELQDPSDSVLLMDIQALL